MSSEQVFSWSAFTAKEQNETWCSCHRASLSSPLTGLFLLSRRMIYKCSMCDTVFTLQSLLCTHFDQHVVNHKVAVFKCPDCSMHFGQKQLMLDHIKVCRTNFKPLYVSHILAVNF